MTEIRPWRYHARAVMSEIQLRYPLFGSILFMLRRALLPEEKMLRHLNRSLRDEPRYQPGETEIFGHRVKYVDASTCLRMFRDAFVEKVNDFLSEKNNPFILDCGANIGLTVLRFKQLYPGSKIIAFEPDPIICNCLRENVKNWNFTDVQVIQAAVWHHNDGTSFATEGSTAGRAIANGCITVPTSRLFDYLAEPVDYIKMDIEGAEADVILDCSDRICNVRSMIIEWHFRSGEPRVLSRALEVLENAGHRYFVHHCWPVRVNQSWEFNPGAVEQILAIHTRACKQ